MSYANKPLVSLTSLQTLWALDAAARHGSYSRAATELGLTHGAVSHRLRALEADVGHALFIRDGNGMRPTGEALRLLVPVRQALDLLATAFPSKAAITLVLRVSLLPSMASRWLMPRVGRFRADNPDIDLRIDARLEFDALGAGGADCAIRYGTGDWSGVRVTDLGREQLFPVCAADYRDRLQLERPQDLANATLLRHARQLWHPWFCKARLNWAEPETGPLFSDTGLLLDAAVAGEGVALARARLVKGELESGRLIRLFPIAVEDRYGYFFVRPPLVGPSNSALVERFARWITDEMRPHE